MTEPTRTSTGIAYFTYDATLNTDASMIVQQKLDLSGNTTAQTFCENAFNLAAERDISGALLADSDITDYDTNNLVYLGSNDVNVQKTFLSANENSTKAQLIALNAYEMTLGKNNQIPLVSNLKVLQIIGYNISTIAGTGVDGYSGDGGLATSAKLYNPRGLTLDSSRNVYIADTFNQCIRKVSASDGKISTIAGVGYAEGYSGDGGPATSARLDRPSAVALDSSGNVYIADTNNNRIRMVNASTGDISTIAGTDYDYGYSGDGGAATSAELFYPYGVVLDSSRNVYIAGRNNHRIRMINAITGNISTIAGTGTYGYSGDGGAATSAQLHAPEGVDLDSYGNLYIADKGNHRIRKVDAITGIISTIAGTGSAGFSGDGGPATDASFNKPIDVAFDSNDNIYIADFSNQRIRMVNASTGDISTIAGNGNYGFTGDGGAATLAQLAYPYGVVLDSSRNVYIADRNNNRIRKLTPIYG